MFLINSRSKDLPSSLSLYFFLLKWVEFVKVKEGVRNTNFNKVSWGVSFLRLSLHLLFLVEGLVYGG